MSRPDIPVTIGGDPRGFESALSRVRNAARSTAGDVMASFDRIKSIGVGAVGLAGAFGVTAFIQAAKTAADAVANIGDEAKRAGMSAKAFQEWKYVAEQARIPVDAITDGLKELQLRADEFAVTGKGSAAEAFERLGLTPQQVKEKLKDPSELLLLLIDRTKRLNDTAAGIRIFDELLGGTGGERMVALIDRGSEGVRKLKSEASDFGNVLSDEVITKAQEIDRQFNLISTTVGNNLKSAIVTVVASLKDFVDQFNEIQNQKNSTIDKRVAELGLQRLDTENKILEAKERQAEFNRAGLSNPLSLAVDNSDLNTYQRQLAIIAEEEKKLVNERAKRIASSPANPSTDTFKPPAYVPPPPSGSKKSSSKEPKLNDYERETQTILKRTDALKSETAAQAGLNPLLNDYGYAIEYAAAKHDLLTAAQEAGVKVTPELTASIEGLAAGYANAVVASEQLAEKQDEIRRRAEEAMATAKDVTRGIIDGFVDGAKAADILTSSLKKIGNALLDDVLSSIFKVGNAGGGGGILSSIFNFFGGKGFSAGGYTGPGGKNDPAGVVHRDEFVFDSDTVRMAGGPSALESLRQNIKGRGGASVAASLPSVPTSLQGSASSGNVTVDARTTIQASGNADTDSKLMAWAAKRDAELPNTIIETVKSAQKRRII